MDVFTCKLNLLASILYMTDDQTLEKVKDSFDTTIAAHLIECDTLAEAHEKMEQLGNNPNTASTVLLHDQVLDAIEVNEYQLAEIEKEDKSKTQQDKTRNNNNHQVTKHKVVTKEAKKDSANREGVLTIEADPSEEDTIPNKNQDKIVMEGVTIKVEDMIKIKINIGQITIEAKKDHSNGGRGDPEDSVPDKEVLCHPLGLEILNTKEYHSIGISVVYAIAEVIMITNAIHYNI